MEQSTNNFEKPFKPLFIENKVPKCDKCPNCGGTGIIKDGQYSDDCIKCNGSGQIDVETI